MLTAGRNSPETLELLLDTHFSKNTQEVEDLYKEENLDDHSTDNISSPDRIKPQRYPNGNHWRSD